MLSSSPPQLVGSLRWVVHAFLKVSAVAAAESVAVIVNDITCFNGILPDAVEVPAPRLTHFKGVPLARDKDYPAGWGLDPCSFILTDAEKKRVGLMSCWPMPEFKYWQCKCDLHGSKCSKAVTKGKVSVSELMQWLARGRIELPVEPNPNGKAKAVLAAKHKAMFNETIASVRAGTRWL